MSTAVAERPATGQVIRFIVPAVPVAQPRQRHTRDGRNYTPSDHPVQAFKAGVRIAARNAYDGPPIDVPLTINLVFVMPRPQKWHGKKFPHSGRFPHSHKPDADNLIKAVTDCLCKITFHDDAQVFCVTAQKWIASIDEQPHVEVTIETEQNACQ